MKNLVGVFIISVFLLSIISVSYAQDGSMFTARAVADREAAMQRVEAAKTAFMEKRAMVRTEVEALRSRNQTYRACKTNTSDDCTRIKDEYVNSSRNTIITSIDAAIQYLTKLKEKISASENINETRAAAITDDIDKAVEELEALKARATNATTPAEIKRIVADVRNNIRRAVARAELHAAELQRAHLRFIIARADVLEKRMDRLQNFLETKNITIDAAKIDEFNAKLEEARDYAEDSRRTFTNAGARHRIADGDKRMTAAELSTMKNLTATTRENVKKARDALADANKILVDILNDIGQKVAAANVAIGSAVTEIADPEKTVEIGGETVEDEGENA